MKTLLKRALKAFFTCVFGHPGMHMQMLGKLLDVPPADVYRTVEELKHQVEELKAANHWLAVTGADLERQIAELRKADSSNG